MMLDSIWFTRSILSMVAQLLGLIDYIVIFVGLGIFMSLTWLLSGQYGVLAIRNHVVRPRNTHRQNTWNCDEISSATFNVGWWGPERVLSISLTMTSFLSNLDIIFSPDIIWRLHVQYSTIKLCKRGLKYSGNSSAFSLKNISFLDHYDEMQTIHSVSIPTKHSTLNQYRFNGRPLSPTLV